MNLFEKLGVTPEEHFACVHCVLEFQDLKGCYDEEKLEDICGGLYKSVNGAACSKCFECWSQECIKTTKDKEISKSENVNHPEHYQGKRECIDIMRMLFGDEAVEGFCRCNAYKYRFRAGRKDGNPTEQDLQKAEWYEEYLFKMREERGI